MSEHFRRLTFGAVTSAANFAATTRHRPDQPGRSRTRQDHPRVLSSQVAGVFHEAWRVEDSNL